MKHVTTQGDSAQLRTVGAIVGRLGQFQVPVVGRTVPEPVPAVAPNASQIVSLT